jgi:hypothetical protein
LKVQYDELLANFAFKFNLRRYKLDADPSKIRSQVIRMVGESQEAVGAATGAGGAAGGSKTPTLEVRRCRVTASDPR